MLDESGSSQLLHTNQPTSPLDGFDESLISFVLQIFDFCEVSFSPLWLGEKTIAPGQG
jgi:hypothetical protein